MKRHGPDHRSASKETMINIKCDKEWAQGEREIWWIPLSSVFGNERKEQLLQSCLCSILQKQIRGLTWGPIIGLNNNLTIIRTVFIIVGWTQWAMRIVWFWLNSKLYSSLQIFLESIVFLLSLPSKNQINNMTLLNFCEISFIKHLWIIGVM